MLSFCVADDLTTTVITRTFHSSLFGCTHVTLVASPATIIAARVIINASVDKSGKSAALTGSLKALNIGFGA